MVGYLYRSQDQGNNTFFVRSLFRCPTQQGHTMSLLRLAVLGLPVVFLDGSRLTFPLRKAGERAQTCSPA